MPEGDTYTAAARRIRPVLIGQTIERVEGSAGPVRRRSSMLLDATTVAVRTLGKHLLIDTDTAHTVHIHLGMPGTVSATSSDRNGGAPHGDVRLALTTEIGTVLVRAAPTVEIDRTPIIDASLSYLGPDLLAPTFDWDRFRQLANRYPSDRTVSDFLLEQRVMAGIGNVYKSEVLFLERTNPRRPMSDITPEVRDKLAIRARKLMNANRDRPMRSTTGRSRPDTWVYGRNGKPCLRCRTPISMEMTGEPPRLSYWCPECQK